MDYTKAFEELFAGTPPMEEDEDIVAYIERIPARADRESERTPPQPKNVHEQTLFDQEYDEELKTVIATVQRMKVEVQGLRQEVKLVLLERCDLYLSILADPEERDLMPMIRRFTFMHAARVSANVFGWGSQEHMKAVVENYQDLDLNGQNWSPSKWYRVADSGEPPSANVVGIQ